MEKSLNGILPQSKSEKEKKKIVRESVECLITTDEGVIEEDSISINSKKSKSEEELEAKALDHILKDKYVKKWVPPTPTNKGIETLSSKIRFYLLASFTVLLILSIFSLLFIIPILVDPILFGLEANFHPALCRTIYVREGSNPLECEIPSCREGCTIDLFSCFFIHVLYQELPLPSSSMPKKPDKIDELYNIWEEEYEEESLMNSTLKNAMEGILLININGCGYPPHINCAHFKSIFSERISEFPCFFSQVNTSIVVPSYDKNNELLILFFSLGVPCFLILISFIVIFFAARWKPLLFYKSEDSHIENETAETSETITKSTPNLVKRLENENEEIFVKTNGHPIGFFTEENDEDYEDFGFKKNKKAGGIGDIVKNLNKGKTVLGSNSKTVNGFLKY